MTSSMKTAQKFANSVYLRAKISADPYNYKVSDRVLMCDAKETLMYGISRKPYVTENMLQQMLGLNCGPGSAGWTHDLVPDTIDWRCMVDIAGHVTANNPFLFYKNDNLLVNWAQLERIAHSSGFATCADLCGAKGSAYIYALMALHTMAFSEASLTKYVPMMFSPELKGMSIAQLSDMEWEKARISEGKWCAFGAEDAPAGTGIEYSYTKADALRCFLAERLDCTGMEADMCDAIKAATAMSEKLAVAYSYELMYLIHKMRDPKAQEALTDLFRRLVERKASPDFSELAKYNEDLERYEISPRLLAAFSDDIETRYANFKELLASGFSDAPNMATMIFALSAHHYAMARYRIRLVQLLYVTGRKSGKISREALTASGEAVPIDPSMAGSGAVGSDDGLSDMLLDLTFDAVDPDARDASADGDAFGDKKTMSDVSTPTELSSLKSELAGSDYEYDIRDIDSSDGSRSAYEMISRNINMLANDLIKQIREIKTYNFGGKNPGKLSGKLDMKNVYKYKHDPHIFYDTTYKTKEMDLAFGIILDESGSMRGNGVKNGRVALTLFHQACLALNIDHAVIGHTSHGMHHCIINRYWHFNEDPKHTLATPYALATIEAKSGNCDSGALFYMQALMRRVPHKDRIVVIFSDGEPTECTDEELKRQVSKMEAEGIHVIGIGVNFDEIREYYPDNANGRNLTEMTGIVVSILERYVLEKED